MTILIRILIAASAIGLASGNSLNFTIIALAGLLPFAVWDSVEHPLHASRHGGRVACWPRRIADTLCFVLPCVAFLDAMIYQWIGHHLWSTAMAHIVTDLRTGLIRHASINVVRGFGILIAKMTAYVIVCWSAGRFAARLNHTRKTILFATAVVWIAAIMITINPRSTEQSSVTGSTARTPMNQIPSGPVTTPKPWSFRSAVLDREVDQRMIGTPSSVTTRITGDSYPDILIVIAESFRPELITPDGTPNLWKLAHEGVWCRNHYSGGNATNHGIFSLVSGLEAIWYSRAVRYSPPMNRYFHAIGYELGFFAGHDDWRTFRMDGYLNGDHYDEFKISPPNGLTSDRQATMQVIEFLKNRDAANRNPRLAVLYLYGTHATYNSYPEDQKFQPAADDRFTIPYSPSEAAKVWNRYRNSAVTTDRFIGAAIGNDAAAKSRIVIFTGDHGESFLEDGTIGHGTTLSPQQNRTPAIIRIPGLDPRIIEKPTMHADVLPTLLWAVGVHCKESTPPVLDGINLARATDAELADRTLVTRNYFDDEIAMVRDGQAMQTGNAISLNDFTTVGDDDLMRRWMQVRFGKPNPSH